MPFSLAGRCRPPHPTTDTTLGLRSCRHTLTRPRPPNTQHPPRKFSTVWNTTHHTPLPQVYVLRNIAMSDAFLFVCLSGILSTGIPHRMRYTPSTQCAAHRALRFPTRQAVCTPPHSVCAVQRPCTMPRAAQPAACTRPHTTNTKCSDMHAPCLHAMPCHAFMSSRQATRPPPQHTITRIRSFVHYYLPRTESPTKGRAPHSSLPHPNPPCSLPRTVPAAPRLPCTVRTPHRTPTTLYRTTQCPWPHTRPVASPCLEPRRNPRAALTSHAAPLRPRPFPLL